ncbi:MAG TPA: stage II sporulation protein M, partial [Acidobacteriaceae bacterium]|nr:stage II sporulation protein M [Acidobacteriaceae bacterium]
MITNRWIERRRPHWDRLSALLAAAQAHGLRSLPHAELREMAFLYRQVASDLSALRQDGSAPVLVSYLNQILGRAHNFLYSGHKNGLMIAVRFLWYDYPRLYRSLQPYVLTSLLLLLAGGLLGSLLTLARPQFMRTMLGPEMVQTIQHRQMWTQSVVSMAPQASSAIMTNNLSVTFTTFAGGILAGLGTVYLIGFNGILLGVVGTACAQAHMSLSLWSFVAAHGSLELPAIVLSGAAGLRLGQGLLFPGGYSRRHAVAKAGQDAVKLMTGVVPMLVVAG